jgi:hypothetical protein
MNLTKGPTRRGNRTGRPVYPKGELTRKVAIILSLGHIDIARALGKGNLAAGVRFALTQLALEGITPNG